MISLLAVSPTLLLASSEATSATSGTVYCKKLFTDVHGLVHISECSDPTNTGRTGYFSLNDFFEQGGLSTIHWKTGSNNTTWTGGKTTVFKTVFLQEEIGACPPGGPGNDSWQIGGQITADHTGSISGPLSANLCTGTSGFYLAGGYFKV
jgi:hypothetical protein